jgi:lipopolysaccharide export system protein LptA
MENSPARSCKSSTNSPATADSDSRDCMQITKRRSAQGSVNVRQGIDKSQSLATYKRMRRRDDGAKVI